VVDARSADKIANHPRADDVQPSQRPSVVHGPSKQCGPVGDGDMAGPRIMCPQCGAELSLQSVERRGGRRMIVCSRCDTLTEWDVETDRKSVV
jgi:hypothetical protein